MAMSGYEWFHMITNRYKLLQSLQMAMNDYEWLQVVANGYKWLQMATKRHKWL